MYSKLNNKLPYVLSKYSIDMTSNMKIRVLDKKRTIYSYTLSELLRYMFDNKTVLNFPLSNLINDRLDNYIDYYKTIDLMEEDDLLFIVEMNTDFLSIKEVNSNIISCIERIADSISIKINKNIGEEKSFSILGGKCDVIRISTVTE